MKPTRIGIIGYGHLGKFLKEQLDQSSEFEVIHVWNRTASVGVLPLENLDEEHLRSLDLVVEVAHPAIIAQYAATILQFTDLFIGSPTCLAEKTLEEQIHQLAAQKLRKVLIPAGAFWGGNDIQKMADIGVLKNLTVTMKKHPSSFKLNSPLLERNEEAKKNSEPTVLYQGAVREVCALAPNNVNTMACAALAASNLGFDKVQARLVADPSLVDWHIVNVEAEGPEGFNVTTERKNPAKPGAVTGQLTYFSFLASIREGRYKPQGVHIC